MKRFFTFVVLASLSLAPGAWAEGADDQYIAIYNLIQQADALNEKGQAGAAMAKYLDAQAALKRFQAGNPSWNSQVVNYRLNYLGSRISQISLKTQAQAAATNAPVPVNAATNAPTETPATTNEPTTPAPVAVPSEPVAPVPATTNATPPSASIELNSQIKAMETQIQQLQADKSSLEAKLKEALSAQPASIDPRELAKAEQHINELQKENDLLKVTFAQVKTNASQVDAAALEQARKDLAEANVKVNALIEANKSLTTEKQALQVKVKVAPAKDENSDALRSENEILKNELADLKGKHGTLAKGDDLSRQLLQAQAQVAALQSDKEILRLEKIALESRLKQVTASQPAVAAAPALDAATVEKIKMLEAQRDELQKSLDVATKELNGRKKGKETSARIVSMTKELATLRARVDTLEAHQIPYTTEELALFNNPDSKLSTADTTPAKKPRKQLSAESGKLVAEAQSLFVKHQYDRAEENYLKVLKEDDKNVFTLGNLAMIQAERGQFDEAEKNLKQALSVDSNDAYCLSILGRVKFQEEKYDEALDALSRAAQLDPQNAETQNYLGITLSHKGLRGPAETALRKAIQLDPGYGSAHNNLAVVYVTQKPPLTELARWHYQKALAAGHPKNSDLEKLLEVTKTAQNNP
ncbi:tetratricopeptide repeat protein [Pedosphaera parvula]|uniref:Tetratricopeptide TPR_2 repeat protein n=1 Tax=Pedosphaera parvula (strain Ellin514) TaxID=320771 RepID=B9XRB7_PEDPL|nr:tetratricopeptide repeat protein [Pedosphaera parvula]EEF57604.1 Tetratricopeptide TPR_2 repeat protein [Pedosphaera parvula Ellin514]